MTEYLTEYDPDTDFDRVYTLATGQAIAEYLRGGDHVLEMGCATGLMTEVFVKAGALVTGIDRSATYLQRAVERCIPDAIFDRCEFSEWPAPARYDHVVATNVIHELPDPAAFLRHCHRLLRPGGLLHLASQNPQSIHRLVAYEMGLITTVHDISARGRQWGTLRLFTADELCDLAHAAGFSLVERQGIMLKPLPNEQMAALPTDVIDGFARVAHRFPEHCAVNYLVLRA